MRRHFVYVNVHGRQVKPVGNGLWTMQVNGPDGQVRTGRWVGEFKKVSRKAQLWACRTAGPDETRITVIGLQAVDK